MMAEAQRPPAATLFVGLMHGPGARPADCLQALCSLFGPVALESPEYAMGPFSTYYEKEMGPGLSKRFLAFSPPVEMERLAECKLAAVGMERRLQAGPARRLFNIDPGLVTSYSVILSTTKNHAHRIYLRDGIFAELTLVFRRGKLEPLDWTYPDYRSTLALDFFYRARTLAGGGGAA